MKGHNEADAAMQGGIADQDRGYGCIGMTASRWQCCNDAAERYDVDGARHRSSDKAEITLRRVATLVGAASPMCSCDRDTRGSHHQNPQPRRQVQPRGGWPVRSHGLKKERPEQQ